MYNQGYSPQNPNDGRNPYPQGNNWYAPPPQQMQQGAGKRRANGGSQGGGQRGGEGRQRKKHSLKWQLLKLLLILIVLAGAGIGGYILKVQSDIRPYMNVFMNNVSVDGIDLSGKTWAQGSQEVWDKVNEKQNGWYVRMKNVSGEQKDITAATLGISFDPTEALRQAWVIGHDVDPNNRKDIFALKEEIEQANKSSYKFSSAEQSANIAPIDDILRTLEEAAFQSPRSAEILSFNPDDANNPFSFAPEVYGQRLDTTAVREQIMQMVQNLESGEVLLETQTIPPAITRADLEMKVSLRARVTTPIASSSSDDRTNNIRTAFGKINGMTIQDGGKFSFNGTVGSRSLDNGFFPAIEYAYGQEVMGVGGGVCQASTTMYLAAIQSGLTITKRFPHSSPVSYTELGQDATVTDTKGRALDLSFKNTSGGTIYIAAHVIKSGNSKRSKMCEVRIYGLSLGNVQYQLVSETVETLPKPEEPTLVEDKDANFVTYVDQTKVSKGREGHVIATYLCTMVDGAEQSRELVSTDTYPARADRVYVGVTPREGF
ncbi:MAG: VanW family protein [Clostridia bacterium]